MTLQKPKQKYTIIDTCIIQAASSKDANKAKGVTSLLEMLINEGLSLAISEFTYYENLHGLKGSDAKRAVGILKKYEWKQITNNVLTTAALFGGFYHDEKIDGIDHGDKIIAATAFLENGWILTENHKDFPNPFFILIKHFPITYKKKGSHQTMDICLYRPHSKLIKQKIEST